MAFWVPVGSKLIQFSALNVDFKVIGRVGYGDYSSLKYCRIGNDSEHVISPNLPN